MTEVVRPNPSKSFPARVRVEEVRRALERAEAALRGYVSSLPPEVQGLAEDLIVVERAILDLGVAVGELRADLEDLRAQLDGIREVIR